MMNEGAGEAHNGACLYKAQCLQSYKKGMKRISRVMVRVNMAREIGLE